jgi:hypothetical protein
MFNAKTVSGLVSKEECDRIISFAEGVEVWENGGNEFWNNRCLSAKNIHKNIDEGIGSLLFDISLRLKKAIETEYKLSEPVYKDLIQVIRWFPGMKQSPHADDMKNSANTERFHHRNFGAIIYLNDNYSGGKTYYSNFNTEITPEVGMLAVHPGDSEHMHGVTEVSGGIRYTIASFWTFDEEYHDGWSIP